MKAGHDVTTVRSESLCGAPDSKLAAVCREEHRCLVTADDDFAQILDYPPGDHAGLVVLRHPRPSLAGMTALVAVLCKAVEGESPVGRLWIVEPARIRIHEAG